MPEFQMSFGSDDAYRAYRKLDSFAQGYVDCMFWLASDWDDMRNGNPNEHPDWDFSMLAPETAERIQRECADFQARANAALPANDGGPHEDDPDLASEQAGHDFWLTRNGHGAGFWDGDWPEPHATRLDAIARSFGGTDLYRGDDGRLYLEGGRT